MKLEFLLAFGTDLQKVKRVVKKVGGEISEDPNLGPALLDRVKSQGVRRMEPTGIVVWIKFMATPGSEVYSIRREVYQRVLATFEKNWIEFARHHWRTMTGPKKRDGNGHRAAESAVGLLSAF